MEKVRNSILTLEYEVKVHNPHHRVHATRVRGFFVSMKTIVLTNVWLLLARTNEKPANPKRKDNIEGVDNYRRSTRQRS